MTHSGPQIDTSKIPHPLMAELGQPLTVTARVNGNPRPVVKWQIGRKKVKESSKFEINNSIDGECSLTIKKASEDLDEGIWVVATNEVGEDCCLIEVKVIAKSFAAPDHVKKNASEADSGIQKQKISQQEEKDTKKDSHANRVSENGNQSHTRKYKKLSTSVPKEMNPQGDTAMTDSAKKITSSMDRDGVKGLNSSMKMKEEVLLEKPPRNSLPKKVVGFDKREVLETDFDKIEFDVGDVAKSEIIQIINSTAENQHNSDVKIVIVNNNDDDDEDEDEDDNDDDDENDNIGDDDQKTEEPHETSRTDDYDGKDLGDEIKYTNETLWLLNGKNIIEFCRELLIDYQMSSDEKPEPHLEVNKSIRVKDEEEKDSEPESSWINQDTEVKFNPDKKRENPIENSGDEKPANSNGDQSANPIEVKKDITEKIPEIIPAKSKQSDDLNSKSPKSTETRSNQEINDEMHEKRKSNEGQNREERGVDLKYIPNDKPLLKMSKENHISNKVAESDDHFLKYRPPSRSSTILSQIDNIPKKPPIHSILGKPPPPPGISENKPLVLTAYTTHKRPLSVTGSNRYRSGDHGNAQNTPRRQKRLDKARSRSADPLGIENEGKHDGGSEYGSKDASSDSINWERLSCTLPGKWGSSSILTKSNLVPTRSEEYLIIRKSDGKVKSLSGSRDNLFRSFQSLDRLNDSETGSVSLKSGMRTLSKQWQVVTVTTTEETFLVQKGDYNTDVEKQSGKTKADTAQKLDEKNKPSQADKGVSTTNADLVDAGSSSKSEIQTKFDNSKRIGIGAEMNSLPRETKGSQTKPHTEVVGQQTESLTSKYSTEQMDGSTQTGTTDQNKKAIPVLIKEHLPVFTFSTITEEEKVKEPDMFVSQINSFEFSEVNTFHVEMLPRGKQKISPSDQNKKNETTLLKIKDSISNKNPIHGPELENKLHDPNSKREVIKNHKGSKNFLPTTSPDHGVHGDVPPFSKFDAETFTPDNHTFPTQLNENIPGQEYVINYSDGKSPVRDLNKISTAHINLNNHQRPSRIPRSVKSTKDENIPDKKRDRSCERVVETLHVDSKAGLPYGFLSQRLTQGIGENSGTSLLHQTKAISQRMTKRRQELLAKEIDGSFSDECYSNLSPRKSDMSVQKSDTSLEMSSSSLSSSNLSNTSDKCYSKKYGYMQKTTPK